MNSILIQKITEIFLYDNWANQKLITNINSLSDEEYLRTISIPFNNVHGLLQHLYDYQEKYFQKIVNKSLNKITEVVFSRNILVEKILECSKNWLDWTKKLDDNSMDIENIFKDIIYLFAHNNYHRGQLQIAVSFLGYQPESIDIFLYKDLNQ